MRIIITQSGEDILGQLSLENMKEREKTLESQRYKAMENSNKEETIMESSYRIKSLKLKQKKVNIPKNISDRYNQINKDESGGNLLTVNTINDTMTMSTNFNTLGSSEGEFDLKEAYTIKELVPKKVYENMAKKHEKDSRVKTRLSKVDSGNFRTNYAVNEPMIELNIMAEKKIPLNKTNLIQYLHTKLNISPNFIKQLSTFDEKRINNVNKICQKFLYSEEQDKLFQKIIQSKVTAKSLKERQDYKNTLIKMENHVRGIKKLIDVNQRDDNHHEKYVYIHREMKEKHWDRYKLDKLMKKSSKINPNKMNHSINPSVSVI